MKKNWMKCVAASFGWWLMGGMAMAQPLGQSQQPLVTVTPPIDAATRQQFGLLTLQNPEGSCSAAMLNDYWAITAAHCVVSQKGNCPVFAANQITLTASWPGNTKTVKTRRVITYGTPTLCPNPAAGGLPNVIGTPSDIAVVQVGLHDFGRPDSRAVKLDARRPMANLTVTGFGRGINTLASVVNGVAVQSSSDQQYRMADFSISSINPNSSQPVREYSFPGNRGATTAAGDSGGPSFIQDWDDPLSPRRKLEWRLMGVHSRATWTCLAGQTCSGANPWPWVSAVNMGWDAAVFPVRSQILADIEAMPADDTVTGTFGTVPASVVSAKRALYVVSEDEPLIAPAGAAIEKQLTFESCHALRVVQGCPVKPEFEQWSYDPGTHRLYHVASGKCVNIFGGHKTAGTPIILYPCQNASNEKWTVVSSGGSPVWSIKSDHSGMCLHADPGRISSGGRFSTGVVTPATLVQRPCNGSAAQRFSNVDGDWVRRHGPH
ncbi:MAG: RICIN domain-containing protein [Bryobacterales bacterium]|nr:RICIN domain-containing protein [Bryobacterales bacterium]